ncbi:NYN domain-containing protein, partial [Aminipila sp.]|uniref:NYN domain-containing protein n=1 Tax=Aminipila sp. TaxID=2060095 RepID=UPI00289BEC90
FYANQGRKSVWKRRKTTSESHYEPTVHVSRHNENKEAYLLVDGYNVIHAWPELKELADENMDGARMKLLDCLSNYQGIRKCQIIVVFDAYRVQGHLEEVIDYNNLRLVYTREAQTADHYIERFAHSNQDKYNITVATSDGLQQIIIRGAGCALLSARELKLEIEEANRRMQNEYQEMHKKERHSLSDVLSSEVKQRMEELIKKD